MKVLVTGGGGFLGSAIVAKLVARGDSVRSFSRRRYQHLDRLGVDQASGNLDDPREVEAACKDCELVFHVAAKPGVWGPYHLYYRTNVLGTQHVLQACRKLGISRLVYTSSPSVVFDGQDHQGADQLPYPRRFLAHYPATKAQAEKFVLQSNSADLATVALRPHLIWGPGDPHLVPRVIQRAKAGRLRLVGGGHQLVDSVFIDNAADAHLLAADKLSPQAPIAGQAYFVTNQEPLPMGELLNRILKAAGLPPVTRSISPGLAFFAGSFLEGIYRLLNRRSEPPMTRFVARQLATAHWYDNTRVTAELGYKPAISTDEGMQRLAAWLDKNPL